MRSYRRKRPDRRPPGRLAAAVLVGVLFAAAGCAAGDDPARSATEAVVPVGTAAPLSSGVPASGAPAAPVQVPDTLRFSAKTLDGTAFSAAELAGKPVVLWTAGWSTRDSSTARTSPAGSRHWPADLRRGCSRWRRTDGGGSGGPTPAVVVRSVGQRTGVSRSVPSRSRSTSGSSTDPSGCWNCSRMAGKSRLVASAEPLRVCTKRVCLPPGSR
ncbi:hypothetical protein GA0070560_102424 [Micromonospora halophytica]|uniref:AhpC/TSA family protein n=1 Tax=Micromonospora halophytica TaxID=47864 RepID=A0A1C5H0N2_9ACTN|nr:hypothetical protein GA0070560_102424 [Micromonospora halophytica]